MLRSYSRYNGVIGIYRIRCLVNDRSYVGATHNLSSRLNKHINHLNKGTHKNKPLQKDYKKFGKNQFEVELLHSLLNGDTDKLLELETHECTRLGEKRYNQNLPREIKTSVPYKNLPNLETKHIRKFWNMVNVKQSDQCWEWRGLRDPSGYGYVSISGKSYRAHRIAYWWYNNRQPGKLMVMHSCDNPPCVNPNHLSLGTNLDNMADRRQKGRGAKLTWEIVRKIRHIYMTTDTKTREISKIFNHKGVNGILQNRVWYDPSYQPPQKRFGPKGKLIVVFNESKTAVEWSKDPRCQVTKGTIRNRDKNRNNLDESILTKPHKEKTKLCETWHQNARIKLILYWDAKGDNLYKINKKLRLGDLGGTHEQYIDYLTVNHAIPEDKMCVWKKLSKKCGVQHTIEITGLPCSVVKRYYGIIGV